MDKHQNIEPDYGSAGEAKLRHFVEACVGGRITRMVRQNRWRPAWFVDVERNGGTTHLHLRGDRGGDVSIFPELRREADVIGVLGEHGIKVPRIYGFCEDPPCILMDAIPGSRDMAEAASDAARASITRDYMAQVGAMHNLPLAPFAAKGVHVPQGAEEIALVGLDAYLPLYLRTKSRPEPMLEFMIGWIRRNVPRHRTKASFIQFDSGQFLHLDGVMTGLYDFEFSMIGDPMTDIATMRMRDSYEPLGQDLRLLCRHYEEVTGEPVDHAVVDFHTLQFAVLGTMQFTGTVGRPRPGDVHSVYLEFDIALRQVILLAMSALTGIQLAKEPPALERVGDNAATLAQLADTIAHIQTVGETETTRKESAQKLVEWLVCSDAVGGEMLARNLADVSALLGRPFHEWREAEAALEAHVLAASADEDERLFRLFGAIEARRMRVHQSTAIGKSASRVHLALTR
jgi:aminoglycoside phosphotransferase (APT) family kinase protein